MSFPSSTFVAAKFEHPKFRALCQVLERAREAGVSLRVNKKDRIWITFWKIAKDSSGCGCGVKYESLQLIGTSSNKRRPCGWRSRPMYINIGQYEMHRCLDAPDEQAPENEFVFRCDLGKGWECYNVFVDVRDLIRQVDVSETARCGQDVLRTPLLSPLSKRLT